MMENIEYPLTDGLRKRIAGLESENARLKERLRWVPVSERLPDDYLSVLLFAGDYVRFGWHTTIDGASWHTDSGLWLRANMGYDKSLTGCRRQTCRRWGNE